MRVNLTPGASRVLRRAETTPFITAESLLLAICEETECRAASLLAEQNIHSDTVRTALLTVPTMTEPVMMEQPVMTEPSLPEPPFPEPASVPDSMNGTDFPNPVVSSDTPPPLTPSSSSSFHKMWDGNDPVYTSPMLSVSPHKSRAAGVEWFVDDVPFFLRPLAPRLGLGMVSLWQHISQRETAGHYGGFSRTNHGNGLGHSINGGIGSSSTTSTGGGVMVGSSSVVGNTNGVVLRVRTKRRSEMEVATEHLLLAIVLSETMAGMWLVSQGITPLVVMEHIGNGSSTENNTVETVETMAAGNEDFLPAKNRSDRFPMSTKTTGTSAGVPSPFPAARATRRMFRILDAAANRAGEAIRVLEDFVRFVLDDTTQTETWKHYRHRFSGVIQQIPYHKRTSARDTETDVGTEIEGQHEYVRRSAKDILAANFSRLQESLRSIEEYSKCVFPEISRDVEKLRYESYTLQKNFPQKYQRQRTEREQDTVVSQLVRSKLYIILDCMSDEETFKNHVETLLDIPVDCIQLRDKTATDQTLVSRAKLLRRLTEEAEADSRPLFIVNDRADIAVLVKADGVHVGQDELTVSQVRHIVGDTMLVGVSTHSIAEARAAVSSGADYIGAGPTFPSSTKHFDDFPGLDYLRKVAADTTITVPIFAIGGLTLQNTPEVLATGITRVAVSSARHAAAEFRKMLLATNHTGIAMTWDM